MPSVAGAVVLLRSRWARTQRFSPGRVGVPRPAWRSQSSSKPAVAQAGTRFGQCGSAYVELAFHEQRHSSAATLLGYARAAVGAPDIQRRCAELLAELETVLDAETLERLLAKGKALDEEAVCALTLETGGCG